jgi:hypothetical protein
LVVCCYCQQRSGAFLFANCELERLRPSDRESQTHEPTRVLGAWLRSQGGIGWDDARLRFLALAQMERWDLQG